MTSQPDISAVVLTFNEALNIRHCLEGVRTLPEVFVVDSGSTDDTVAICREYTDRIVEHPYRNHAEQWQWALDHLPIKTDWILALDADFVVSPQLLARITEEISRIPQEVAGVYVRHLYIQGFEGGQELSGCGSVGLVAQRQQAGHGYMRSVGIVGPLHGRLLGSTRMLAILSQLDLLGRGD